MDRRKLHTIGSKLDLTSGDVRSIRKKRFREKWFIPIISIFIAAIGPIIGFLSGRNAETIREYEVTSRSDGYPFSIGVVNSLNFLTLLSVVPLSILNSRTKNQINLPLSSSILMRRKLLNCFLLLLSIFISYLGFRYSYELAQPHETTRIEIIIHEGYSQSIDYGVYSGN